MSRRNDRNRARRRKAWPKRKAAARAAYWAHCDARDTLDVYARAWDKAAAEGPAPKARALFKRALLAELEARKQASATLHLAESSRLAFRVVRPGGPT